MALGIVTEKFKVLISSETLILWFCNLLVTQYLSLGIKNYFSCLWSCFREVLKQQSDFQEVWIAHSARYGNMLFLDLEESKFTLEPIPCVDNSKPHLLNTPLIWTP